MTIYPGITRTWNPIKHENNKLIIKLLALFKLKSPQIILVSPKVDLFSSKIPHDWASSIVEFCKCFPQHTFIFCTDYPFAYNYFNFSENCRLGVKLHKYDQSKIEIFRKIKGNTFAFINPLQSFEGVDLSMFKEIFYCSGEFERTISHKNMIKII